MIYSSSSEYEDNPLNYKMKGNKTIDLPLKKSKG